MCETLHYDGLCGRCFPATSQLTLRCAHAARAALDLRFAV